MRTQPAITLTIGGSDSGGAAGIQADLKTWTTLGVYGMSALTAVTAQNSVAVLNVRYLNHRLVGQQITAVLDDYGAHGIKTGFIGRAATIAEIAARLREHAPAPLVVDPVLVNHMGGPMFGPDVTAAYRDHLLPLASLVTPNWYEAALLGGAEIQTSPGPEAMAAIGQRLVALGAREWLVTGVPAGEKVIDYWFDGQTWHELPLPRLDTENRHGSGDTLSAAICAHLAQGAETAVAIGEAQQFTAAALAASSDWQLGRGHGPLSHFDNS